MRARIRTFKVQQHRRNFVYHSIRNMYHKAAMEKVKEKQ